ncbi:13218_t:CDS:2 [Gigaspora rosea]|nr:13218_t:CDS:2 [Gigaspora rosea]
MIQRIRHFDLPTKPLSLEDLIIPDHMKRTLKLIDFSEEHNINLDPHVVLTDFEAVTINSVQLEFDDVQNKGCHFHFSQCIYRKVQAYGLASRYAAYEELKTHIPDEAGHVVRWFEETFIYSRVRHTHRNGNISRSEPLFPPTFWSVADNIEYDYPRMQNSVEGWHRRWDVLVDCAHAGIFRILKEIQKKQNRVELDIEAILQGALRPPQKRYNIEREQRIQTVFNDCSNRSIMEYLRGIAHNLVF